jgi:hypothetical protein
MSAGGRRWLLERRPNEREMMEGGMGDLNARRPAMEGSGRAASEDVVVIVDIVASAAAGRNASRAFNSACGRLVGREEA